ncbi:hypothetical protein LPJ60_000105 [Coemansia sp. RSA 2675]|nr:hypothetical protein LPJ60_000105 [Coemansia sp. RSA 2675]
MVQAAATAAQGPVTPSRQLGAARGPRRTPASRTKKPYTRPALASQGSSSSLAAAEYETDAAPGFMHGMRSLVARLWGTSLKSSSSTAAPAPNSAADSHKCTAESNSDMRIVAESAQASAMQPVAATASIAREEVATFGRHAATVSEHSRSRRPTVESVFAPSPFAYNKKLATATPSVANLRDVERVRDQPSTLSRRHSVGRIDLRRPRLSVGVSHSSFQSGLADGDDPAQCLSPSGARRLLSTLNSINSPILDARGRLASGLPSAVGVASGLQYSATAGERLASLPLRRLPVSLLALSDTPNKIHRSPLSDSANVLDKETLRRSSSLRGTLRSQNTAPSLARTIQMKQARKAVAERLLQYKSAESSYAGSDASSCSAAHSPLSAAPELFEDAPVAGVVHSREEDEEQTASKRRRAASGGAVRLSGDGELDGVAKRASGARVGRPKQATGKRLGRAGRSLSTVDSNIKWRFSARLAPASDDEADSSSESDEDREALTAKVPLSKIRGGELLGLSQHLTTSTQSTSSGVGLSAVRSTGFGSTRMPIPIFSEPETKETAPAVAPPAASASTTAPLLSFAPVPAPAVPVSESAPAEAVPVAKTIVPASSSLFSGISFKPASEAAVASKPEAEKPTAPVAPAASSASLFSFSKPAETAEKPADVPDNTSEVPTAPTTPVFSCVKTSAADTSSSVKPIADTWGKSTALSGAFGVKAPTADTTGATTPELAPKPVTSAPTFSFNLSKPAASASTAEASKPAAAPSLFSLGSIAPSAPATTTAAAEDKPKTGGSFNFGSFGAPSSSDAPNILTTKRARGDEAAEPASAASKPVFNFQSAATGGGSGGFNFASSASTSATQLFGSQASKDAGSTAAVAAPAAAASGFGSTSAFSLGAAAPSASTSTASKPFTFDFGAKPVAAPEKVVDTTMDSSDSNVATSAPGSIFGSGTAPLFGTPSNKAPAASTSTFSFGGSTFGGSAAAKPSTGPAEVSTPIFGGFGQSTTAGSAVQEPAAKKPMFSLGASVGTPGASIFESASIATPSTTNFTNAVAAVPTPAFGAAAATPSVLGFGSAVSSAATPASTGFNFGAKPSLQQSNTFGSISSQLGTSGFGNTSTSSTGGGNAFGSMVTTQPISNGFGNTQPTQSTGSVFGNAQPSQPTSNVFGSTQPAQTTNSMFGNTQPSQSASNVFGNSQPPQTTSGAFGASSGGLGFGSNSGQRNVSTGSFNFGNSTSSTTGAGGFGQQQQQPASSAVPSFGGQSGGFGSTASNSAFGGASNTSAFGGPSNTSAFGGPSNTSGFGGASNTSAFGGPSNTSAFGAGPSAPTSQFQFGQSNQTPSTTGFRFGAPPAAGSAPQTPFQFTSNASVQEGGPPTSLFQIGGVAQHSSTGVGGGMSLGRVTGASNASATSQGRRIARPRGRRH